MNASALSVKTISRRTKWFFGRFHTLIYFIFVSAALGFAIINLLGSIEDISTDDTYQSSIDAGSIDSSGLERISNLKRSDEVRSLPQLPSDPRSNPFAE